MAYTGASIVDYLNSVGQDSSYAARARLAQQKGISNYTGTAAQNTQLLNNLRTTGAISSSGNYSNIPLSANYLTSGNNYIPSISTQTTTPSTNYRYQAPSINSSSLLQPILSGQIDPSNAANYISSQVRNAYIQAAPVGSNYGINAFSVSGQQQINQILSQLQGKNVIYGGQVYQFGNGGQAVRTSTPITRSITSAVGTSANTSIGGYRGVPITAGTDAEIQAQIRAIDANIGKGGLTEVENQIEELVSAALSSGQAINPNLSLSDFAGLTLEDFMREAERVIAPQYREQIESIKTNLTRNLSDIGYDLGKIKEENQRVTAENLRAGEEDLAGRGLAFSSNRGAFRQETASALSRANEAAEVGALRSAQSKLSGAEQSIGTQNVTGLSVPSFGNRYLQFGATPQVGSINYQQRAAQSNYAQNLESRARNILTSYPNTDQSALTRALGFS